MHDGPGTHDGLDGLGPKERARFTRVPEGGGTELLAARFVDHRFPLHTHDRYVFGMVTRGVEIFRYRGIDRQCGAGSLAILHPDEAHDGRRGVEGGWSYRMSYLEPEEVRRAFAQASGRDNAGLPSFAEPIIEDPIVAARFLALFETLEASDQALERESLLLATLGIFALRHASERSEPTPPGRERAGVRRARDRLAGAPEEPVTLDALAGLAGLSPYHFLRCFSAAYGLPPHMYQTSLRVALAERLLASGESIAATAVACGFTDQSHLTRAFRKIRGVTPGIFRRSGLFRNSVQERSGASA